MAAGCATASGGRGGVDCHEEDLSSISQYDLDGVDRLLQLSKGVESRSGEEHGPHNLPAMLYIRISGESSMIDSQVDNLVRRAHASMVPCSPWMSQRWLDSRASMVH